MLFNGKRPSIEKSDSLRILKEVPLRYNKNHWLKKLVGLCFIFLGFFWMLFFLALGMAIFDLPNGGGTKEQRFLTVAIFAFSITTAFLMFIPLFNRLFVKKVSLIEINEREFKLCINEDEYIYRKSEITKVKKRINRGKGSLLAKAILILKVGDESYHFSTDKTEYSIESMYQHLEEWRMNCLDS